MKKKILILSLCSFLLVCSGCKKSVKLKNGKEVIASVKGKNITAEELFDELKKMYGSSAVINMVDNYIIKKEITDNSKAKEYAAAQVKSLRKQYEDSGSNFDDILAQSGYTESQLKDEFMTDYNKKEVAKKFIKKDITDDEIEEYYEKEIYGNYTVKHILITPDATDSDSDEDKNNAKEKAKEKAKEVIKKLDDGEKWEDLVKEYSDDDGSKKNDGLVKNFTKGDVVDEFFNATLDLKNGKYTKEPVESTYGYHIILKVSNTKKPSLKKSKEKILEAIATNKMNNDTNLYDTTWVNIRKKYKLNITDTTVNKAYKKSISK